ncbi:radical SAM/SPASM domain-containing protein [Mycobacteroides salmoniphilum]|uniref:radical SAM/SPASM domain-containing protein n=1 Tax=Mycobacteroides salmoniphilum TaxID=404941 RepID=UPI00356561F7
MTTATTFAWLEITGKCQLECTHCYADSGPAGSHGQMRRQDWERVIDELAAAGVVMVQFIGGEPMLHPDLGTLIDRATTRGLWVEVYSNLVHVPASIWPLLERPGVSLATSYYSDDPTEHNAVTGRNSHARTRANIEEAIRRGITVRGGVVEMKADQRAGQAVVELGMLGVENVRVDHNRGVGRGRTPDTSQLCGKCTSGRVAISPSGEVWPCVFSRWLPIGNVLEQAINDVLNSVDAEQTRAELDQEFTQRRRTRTPRMCGPNGKCNPDDDCDPTGPFLPSDFDHLNSPCDPIQECPPGNCPPAGNGPISRSMSGFNRRHETANSDSPCDPIQECPPGNCPPAGNGPMSRI